MELFTLGIGNYTEQDVKEAARAFTGWTVNLRRGTDFVFNARQHDSDPKTFLGVTGNLNGDDVLDIIFSQPAHPKFVARKLFRFFVYDDPDDATVNRFADVYLKSGFSIKELMTQLLLSPEFRSDKAFYSLVKSPAEFTIGAMRALSANITDVKTWAGISKQMAIMGQQIYAPPNVGGWPGNTDWANSTAYFARAEMARLLVSIDNDETVDPTEIARAKSLTSPSQAVDYFLDLLVQSDAPADYRACLDQLHRHPQWRQRYRRQVARPCQADDGDPSLPDELGRRRKNMGIKRRELLKNGLSIAALGLVAPSFLVKSAYALTGTGNGGRAGRGELPGHGPLVAADSTALKKNILVVVQMSGGNDGLGTVIPYTDQTYFAARPTLAPKPEEVLRLTDSVGLHPALKGLQGPLRQRSYGSPAGRRLPEPQPLPLPLHGYLAIC